MREWLRSREKAVYRVGNAALLICMVLFGAERYLGVGELDWMHFGAAFLVLGALAGVNYMTARGRILCVALLLLLFCACLAAGPGSSPAFWQSFFPWLVGMGRPPQGWETAYGLLQTAILAAICYLAQMLFEKTPLLKSAAAVALSGILLFCLLTRRDTGRLGTAFLICFILLAWEERVQRAWDKRRGKGSCPEAHTVWILFFVILYFGLLVLMPAPDKPYDWMWARNIYHKLQESALVRGLNRKWGGREGFGMAFTGFSGEGELGGDLQQEEREVMWIRVRSGEADSLYLTGAVYDAFDGRGWSRTAGEYGDAAFLDVAQTLYAVRNYDRDSQRDYLKEVRIEIRYVDFQTGYFFAPLKTWVLDGEESRDAVCGDGVLLWDGRKGYGTEYGLRYFRMNVGRPGFDTFLEEAGKVGRDSKGEREIWESVMIECERNTGRVFAPEDMEAYRGEVYGRYMGQAALSGEMERYLGEILGDAETEVEKLRAIEEALSALTYTLTPGALPDEVEDGGDFLDYFLLESRQGYCTYFATAFVLLARAEGIPARYVQGYCVPVGEGEEVCVYSYMAHAWPEAYIEGVGWIPFEPTPGYMERRYDSWKMSREEERIQEEIPRENPVGADVEPSDGEEREEEEPEEESPSGYSWKLFGTATLLILSVCGMALALENILGRYRYGRMTPGERLRAEASGNLRLLSWLGLEREEWETLEEFRERAAGWPGLRGGGRGLPLCFTEKYESVIYGGKDVDEAMLRETVAEREELLGMLKEERRWLWLYCRVRLYLGRYRFYEKGGKAF